MAIDFGGMGGTILGWFSSLIFWVVIFIILGITIIGFLWIRKGRSLNFTAFEMTFLKDGKVVLNQTKAGWYGKKKAFLGLWDYGVKVMKLKDGRIVHDFSVDDYHELRRREKGKRCILVTSHPEDKSVVYPISKAKLTDDSYTSIYEVASADFREAAVDAFNESTKELRGSFERVLPYILLGGIVIFFIIGMIVQGQMISRAVETAKEVLLDAGDTLESIAQMVSTKVSSTAP